jgi:hypothetical protein
MDRWIISDHNGIWFEEGAEAPKLATRRYAMVTRSDGGADHYAATDGGPDHPFKTEHLQGVLTISTQDGEPITTYARSGWLRVERHLKPFIDSL